MTSGNRGSALMRFSHFFVDRPIFASVVSIVALIVGAIAYTQLPVAQYPEIAPPTIVVRAQYPGADAETVAATVATPLEQMIESLAFFPANRVVGVLANQHFNSLARCSGDFLNRGWTQLAYLEAT